MEAIWWRGIDFIQAIQSVHGPILDAVFNAITFMGDEEFFLILLPLVYWCVDFTIGVRLVVVFLLSTYANTGLKDVLQHPRPFELDPTVRLREAEGYGLPSGHSQSAVVVWGLIAAEFRKTWLWIVAVALMVLIGFSRIYLGVHFPTDVLGGWAVGTILLAVYIGVGSRFEGWLKQVGLAWRLALAIVIPLVLLLHSSPDTVSGLGVLMGMGVGAALTGEVAPYSAEGPLKQRILRFLVGIVGVLLIYLGLKTIFPEAGAPLYLSLRFVRYALVGLWAGVGAPWAFLRLGLAPHR